MNIAKRFFHKRTKISSIFPFLISLNIGRLGLGMVTNIVIASHFGASSLKDGLEAAIAIPRQLVATFGLNSLGGSSLYVIGRLSSSKQEKMQKFLSTIFLIQSLYSIFFLLVLNFSAEPIINIMSPGMSFEVRKTAISALSWTAWIVIIEPMITLFGSANAGIQIYGTLQIAAMIERLGVLIGVLCIALYGPIAYPAGLIIAFIISAFLLANILSKSGLKLRYSFAFRTSEIKEAFKLSLPWIISAPLLNFASWILIPLMIAQGPGAYSSYLYANILSTMVVTILITPFNDGFSPILAKNAGSANSISSAEAIAHEQSFIKLGFRMSILLGVTATVFTVIASKSLVGIIYFHGAMTADAARQIAMLLSIIGFGLFGQAVIIFFGRFFQARIAIFSYILTQAFDPLVKLGIVFLLIKSIGIYAIAVGMAISSLFAALIGWLLTRKQVARGTINVDIKIIIWISTMIILALISLLMPTDVTPSLLNNVINLFFSCLLVFGFAWGTGALIKLPEINQIKKIVLNKLNRFFPVSAYNS